MSTQKRNQLSEIMRLAWQFVRKNGFSMSEALKCAWANLKLKAAMKDRIVKFYFQKVDGSIREAFGTLKASLLPPANGEDSRRKSDTVQVYFDTEKSEYRCFKKANLIKLA
nr:SH3 beta-barrel fold-containing protein [uncultured Bacteroides sp.]